MADEPDPPRKFYQLKPREFEVVNVPSSGLAPGQQLRSSPPPQKIEVRDLYQQAGTPGPVLAVGEKVAAKNEVHVLLHDNLTRANAAGVNELTYKPKRRSKRTRDYFLVVIPLDVFFGYAAFGHYSNVAMMAYGVAGIIITTLGLGWVMFFVMDDY
jgi:hypothetical protein